MNNGQIESESKFLLKFLLSIIKLPLILIQIIFRKKRFGDLFEPLKLVYEFIISAKFTFGIIVANIIIFFISMTLPEQVLINLMNFPSDLFHFRIWTLITAGFLHGDLMHLLFNMLGIFVFGRIVERNFGIIKTAIIYFAAMIISHVFSSVINYGVLGIDIPGIGASGALMGLIAAAILIQPFYITYEALIPMPVMVLGWLAIYADIVGILGAVNDGIGHLAHIGGFISITIIAYFMGGQDRKKMRTGLIINIASVAILYFISRTIGLSFL